MKKLLFLLTMVSFMSVNILGQAIPKQIDYQGVLKTAAGVIVPDGNYPMTFKIYNDPTGGAALWTETQTVAVANGLFSAHLGSVTPITGVPFDRIQFLGITLGAEPELLPRTTFTPSPYSFMSMKVVDDGVTSAMIIDEPGLAEVGNTTTHSLAGITTMTSIATLSITIPAAGFIVLEGKTIAWLSGVTGQNEIYMQIDETEGGTITSPYWTKAGLQAYATTGQAFFPVSCQRTFSKGAGTYTFYLEAQSVSGNGTGATTNLYQTQLRAIFYPTAYGSVSSLKESSERVDESIPLVK